MTANSVKSEELRKIPKPVTDPAPAAVVAELNDMVEAMKRLNLTQKLAEDFVAMRLLVDPKLSDVDLAASLVARRG